VLIVNNMVFDLLNITTLPSQQTKGEWGDFIISLQASFLMDDMIYGSFNYLKMYSVFGTDRRVGWLLNTTTNGDPQVKYD